MNNIEPSMGRVTFGTLEKLESLGEYFPLSPGQIERTKVLRVRTERIHIIQKRMLQGLEKIYFLKDISNTGTCIYIGELYRTICENSTVPEVDDLTRLNIQDTIDGLYKENKKIDTYTPAYYAPPEEARMYLIYFGLLEYWSHLGYNHPGFGKLPTIYDFKSTEAAKIWSRYFHFRDLQTNDVYFWTPLEDTKTHSARFTRVKAKRAESIVTGIPNNFSMMGIEGYHPDILTKHLEWLEEIYVLGSHAALSIMPYPELIVQFLKKHKTYFQKYPAMIPGNWQINDADLEIIWANTVEKSEKKKSRAISYTTPQVTYRRPHKNNKEVVTSKANIPAPIIGNMEYFIRNNKIQEKAPIDIIRNIPPDILLYIQIQHKGEDDIYIYNADEIMRGFPVFDNTDEATYTIGFCFADKIPLTSIQLKIKPRLSKESLNTQTKPDIISTNSARVNSVTRENTSKTLASIAPTEEDYHIELALELIALIETGRMVISRKDSDMIFGVFERDIEKDAISFEYSSKYRTVSISGCPTSILTDIEGHIITLLEQWIQREQDEYYTIIENKLGKIDKELSIRTTALHQLTKEDELMTPSDYRVNNMFSGLYWIVLPRYKKIIDDLIQLLRTFGIHIEPKREGERELSLSISLEGEAHISGKIISKNSSPYYELRDFDEKIHDRHRELLVGTLKHLLMFIGLAGKMKHQIDSSAPSHNKKISQISIEDVLTKQYDKGNTKKSWNSYSKNEQDSMSQALARLKRGEGKELIGGGYNDESGYYEYRINGHKHLNDILADSDEESVIIIYDEKISTAPAGEKGHPYVYEMLRTNVRLQKYWILRLIATAIGKPWKGKTPFANGLYNLFEEMWDTLSQDKKREFLNKGSLKAGSLLDFKRDDSVDSTFLMEFVTKANNSGIQLRYSRPMTLTLGELILHEGSIELIGTYTAESEDD